MALSFSVIFFPSLDSSWLPAAAMGSRLFCPHLVKKRAVGGKEQLAWLALFNALCIVLFNPLDTLLR
jgi:hypothetical protein